jgi:hypothetical protein
MLSHRKRFQQIAIIKRTDELDMETLKEREDWCAMYGMSRDILE